MSQKIINDQGEEVEVFTQEELEIQKNQAIEDYKTNNPDKSNEIAKLQADLEKANKDLEGFKNKDMNFSAMRSKIAEKEKEIEEIKLSIDNKIGAVKKEILEGVVKDHYNSTIENLSGGDKELKDKIEYHYKRLADTVGTKEEIEKKLNDAFVLATGNKPAINSSVFSSGGVSKIQSPTKEKLSPEEQELLDKLIKASNIKIK